MSSGSTSRRARPRCIHEIEDPSFALDLVAELAAEFPVESSGSVCHCGSVVGHDDLPPNDWRRTIPRYSQENFPNILKLCDGLAAFGKKYNATAGQIALAWLLAQGEDIIPIVGTTKLDVSSLSLARPVYDLTTWCFTELEREPRRIRCEAEC